ncbi:SAM dependent carboxyl methyltransferase [Macleaya cordata]|uniref:SAM dependent carboxyl methyltransferase n=1 Tax=Macleaya cordata TaxID=56857 RepID=A0A200QUU6_MACCD|nr:SAM dependent carboxyl methyltransferase [Macleaya cordata]
MEVLKTQAESFPMNGGDGVYSYVKNSSLQRSGVDSSKALIEKAIAEKLDVHNLPNSNSFRIVDLGCSVGPNTFIAVQNIIEAVDLKYKSQGLSSETPEFHVFFSDHTFNDFNTLFASLPERKYFAAGVPGSFYTRLFPQGSLHIVHSSFALQWLSRVPKEVVDINSPAWNKGRIHYTNAPNEVAEAYSAQYAMDTEAFLRARAQEIVCGGLMVILVAGVPNGTPPSQATPGILFHLLGSCLMDMAKRGTVDEAKVDSFNLPVYTTSPQEVEALVEKNGCFSIEKMEAVVRQGSGGQGGANRTSTHIRAGMEGIIKEHFGSEILDELFDRYSKKLADSQSLLESGKTLQLFILLKRNTNVC